MAFNCKAVLLDIEGTTTSISFVKDTLFPYAAKNCKNYLNENWTTEETKAVVSDLVALSKKDVADGVEEACEIKESDDKTEFISALFKNIEWQMSKDRKSTELKQLQGLIWKKAYEDASIKGHVFDDVSKNFETWTTDGLKLYIFSSGSVDAQKLLFSHSEQGDLSKYLSGYYDTKVGPKQDLESYKKIATEIGLKEEEIVFLTDIVKEAEAAESAGFKVALLNRPGNSDFDDESKKKYTILKTFDDLKITTQTSAKRKIEDSGKVADEEVAPSKIAKTEITEEKVEKADEKPATETAQNVDVKVANKNADDAMEVDVEETKKVDEKHEEKEMEKESDESKKNSTEEIKTATESETVKETTTAVVEKTDDKSEPEEKTVEPQASENVPKEKEKETAEAMEVDGTVKSTTEKSSTEVETKEEKEKLVEETKTTESAGESSKDTETVKTEKSTTETTTEKNVEESTKSAEPEVTEKETDKETEEKKNEKTEPEVAKTSESSEVANGHDKSEASENGSTKKTEANGDDSATVENGKTTDLNGDNKTADENETIVAPKETVDPKDSALVAVDYKRKQVMAYVAKDDVPPVEAES